MRNAVSIWPPVLDSLVSELIDGEKLVLAISPFIKRDALEALIERFPPDSARVIVRWRMDDLLSGVSDIEIFDVLDELGLSLYINQNIHLKVFQFSSGSAYCGSSNITGKGLSLNKPYNDEMGVLFDLDLASYTNIRRICDESRLVTPGIVMAYKNALAQSIHQSPVIAELFLPPVEEKEFLISALPATECPESFFFAISAYLKSGTAPPEFLHDVGSLNLIEEDLKSEFIKDIVAESFRNRALIQRIVEKIRSEKDMNFGAVTKFVHTLAQDVPLPYRSVIKEAVGRLYPWLAYYFEDISYHTPGKKSAVIRSSLTTGQSNSTSPKSRRGRRKRR